MSSDCSVVESDASRIGLQGPAEMETVEVRLCLTAGLAVESRSGIVLIADNAAAYFIGQEVSVTYLGSPKAAFVRRIVDGDDGKARIGLEWNTM